MYVPKWLIGVVVVIVVWVVARRILQIVKLFSAAPEQTEADLPLVPRLLEAYMIRLWAYLGVAGPQGKPMRIAIFGAGRHTFWLANRFLTLPDVPTPPRVVAVLDDHPENAARCWDLSPIKPEQFNPADADAIVISSDTANRQMRQRCKSLFGDKIRIIDPYNLLPPGPYPKL